VTSKIRQAHPDECSALTELTMRSKAHWGYDATFMADVREDLEIVADRFLPDFHVYVLESDTEMIGFYSLCPVDAEAMELTHLFIEPKHIGSGFGKQLLQHSLRMAQSLGFQRLTLSSDPYAESFYASQGTVRIGEKESTVRVGRMLPLMEYVFDSAGAAHKKLRRGISNEIDAN
jgi:N-acetylglutamate synthase-like GNAT family acetyltransferase